MKLAKRGLIAAFAFFGFYISTASAMLVTVEDTIYFCAGVADQDSCSGSKNFNLIFPNIAATANGAATLTLFGDFEGETEFATISNPSFIGTAALLNDDPDDDAFDNSSFGDMGNDYQSAIAIVFGGSIPMGLINSVLGTSVNNTSFDVSSTVENNDIRYGATSFATLKVQYQANDQVPVPVPVPLPTTFALFGLGLAGLGWSRRKKA